MGTAADAMTAVPYRAGSFSAGASAGGRNGGGGTFAPVITITVDASGADFDEEKLTEVVLRRMAPALEAAQRQHERSMGAR